jgi:tyrosine-protein kinase Etk/Wzc
MQNEQFDTEDTGAENSALEGIDISKVLHTLRKNIPWIILIMLFTNTLAYFYIRYTRPMYESNSLLRLDIKREATILGFNGLEEQNLNTLAGEIELLKSNLFFSRVVDALDMDISYYAYGRVLFQERYKNSPFRVEYELKDPSFLDKPIDIELINKEQFVLSYNLGSERFSRAYEFGEEIKHPSYRFVVSLTEHYESDLVGSNYYFTINSDQSLVNYLSGNMTVEPVNFNAKTIRVGFRGYDREKIRDLVAIIDSVYLEYTKEKKNQATEQKLTFLEGQLTTIESRLSTYENYFENFTIDNKTNNLKAEIGEVIGRMEELDAQKFQLQNTLEAINKLQEQIAREALIPTEPTGFIDYPPEIQEYINQLNELLNERELLLSSYKSNTFAVERKEQKVTMVKQDIMGLLNTYDTQLTQQINELDKKKEDIENRFVQLPSKGTQYGKNERYYSLYEEIFLSLIQKKNELEIARAGTVTDFVVLMPATLPASPVAPEKFTIYGVGAVSGIILSLLFLAVGYVLNDKISSQSELEKLISPPMLGAIPQRKAKSNIQGLVVSKSPNSYISESFRSIRTNMQFMGLKDDKKVISVTSTVSAEGKTFVVCNLGYVIALSGQKVVVVDVDLRLPKIHHNFNIDNAEKGLSTHLIGEYPLAECINDVGIKNLDVITAGPIPPNPSELISSKAFQRMLEELEQTYDVIILDTPPVGLVTDGVLVMENADIPLYVFRADYSRRNFVRTLHKLYTTRKFPNLSVVLNGQSTHAGRDYTYNKYGYGYYAMEEESRNGKVMNRIKGWLGKKDTYDNQDTL